MSVDPLSDRDDLEDESLELGRQIRLLRRKADLTLHELARAARVSKSLISQVERGLASPSISALRRIASALDVPIAALFLGNGGASDGERDSGGRRLVVRRDERKGLHVPRSKVVYELLTPDLNRKIEFIWI